MTLIFGHICRLSRDTSVSQALHLSIDAFTGTPPATDWKRPPGRPHGELAFNKWKNGATHQCLPTSNLGPPVVIATTLSRSSAAVIE